MGYESSNGEERIMPETKFVTSEQIKIHDEEYFQPQDHIAFYPGTKQDLSLENFLLVMVIVKLMKTEEGQKRLERLATKYLDVTGRIIESVADSSKTNWLNGINNVEFCAAICHKLGLISDGGYLRMMNSVRSRFDKLYLYVAAQAALGGVTTLIQGSKYEAGEKGISTEGIATIAQLLKSLGK